MCCGYLHFLNTEIKNFATPHAKFEIADLFRMAERPSKSSVWSCRCCGKDVRGQMREMVHFLDSRSMELVILEHFLPFVVRHRRRSMSG